VEDSRQYLDPEVLNKLTGLELQARLIVEGYVSGLHKSPYHGFSVEFAEHREYVPGDDLRYVDWKVFGKTDRYYLKQYEEETNFACHLLLDTSESMQYRSEGAAVSKLDYARYVAASLAYLITQQQDAVGLTTFDSEITNFLQPSSQPSHLKRLLHLMEEAPAQGETSLGSIFHSVAERTKQRGLVIIISDLFDDLETLLLGLKHLKHCRHDVSLLQVIDPAEQDFPFDEPTLFHGLEISADQMVDPRSLKDAYHREFDGFLKEVRSHCRNLQMEYTLLRTDMPLDVALASYLNSRMHRNSRI